MKASERSTSSRRRCAAADYLPDRGLATALFLALALEKPLLLEGEAGVGKTEAAKALAARARRAADPAPVLRGARRRARRLRVELLRGSCSTSGRAGGNASSEEELFGPEFLIRRPLLEAIESAEPRRAADRRDRPRRRGVRGVPARGAVGLPDHDPGDRHDPRRAPAGRRPDLEPHARAPRRAQAALSLPLDRASVARARDRDRQAARARSARAARRAGGRVRPRAPRPRPRQAARASPRRSTGRGRSPRSAARSSTPRSSSRRSARCSSTTRTSRPCATTRSPRLVEEARAAR